jgi:asparagine synthase (glutamine-hydrolysing)
MCGIAAIIQGRATGETPDGALERMTASLRHRGPDAQACVRLPGCEIGHTRLSIIDIEGGAQPMSDASRRYHLVFNGEIFNHRELRRELENLGARFRTRSDTEVLLHAYEHFGERMLARLNGQFAFAIWDSQERQLFVARDRFGEKPLYWAVAPGGQVVLASEIKAILASGMIAPRIDRTSVDAYLGLYYVPPDRTIYSNVHTLPAGHSAVFHSGEPRVWRYWEPQFSRSLADEDEAVERVQTLFGRAVERQMVADVPVGAFLSGGLDSTTIVGLMSSQSSDAVRTYAVGFGDLINELPFARAAAEKFSTRHHEMQMNIDVPETLARMMQVYDEPFGDSSNVPTYLVAKYAREHVKVVLSGDGGDEIFGGYAWYTPLLQGDHDPRDWFDAHLANSTVLNDDRGQLWGDGRSQQAREVVATQYRPARNVREIDQATAFDVGCYLPGDILVKVDRAAMAHGLETRAPFLDAELADFVLGLPWQMRFKNGRLKHLLRAAFEHLWPESIRSRGKQGFGAPVRAWLEIADIAETWRRITRSGSALCALLPGLPRVANDLRPQRQWSLLCLGLWLEGREACLAHLP